MSVVTENERLANAAIYEHINPSISELFHENSKLNLYTLKLLQYSMAQAVSNPDFKKASLQNNKVYPTAKRIPLKKRSNLNSNLGEDILNRKSERKFKDKPLTFQSLSDLLSYSGGISHVQGKFQFRTYPSGGALYPLEIYLLVNKVKSLEQGVYHFNVRSNCLEQLKVNNVKNEATKLGIRDQGFFDSAVTIMVSAVFKRTTYKYGDRGYRFVLMEVGHLLQNISLVATALGIGSCEIGGYQDDEDNQFLNIDGVNEAIVGEMILGYPDVDRDNTMPGIYGGNDND